MLQHLKNSLKNIRSNRRKFTGSSEKLAKRLDWLCDYLDDEWYINSGGCCYIAYLIAKMLEEDDIKYIVAIEDRECYYSFRNISEPCNHYFLKVGDVYINSCNSEATEEFENISSAELLEHYNKHCWNDNFNIQDMYFIRKTLRSFYNEFKKEISRE